MRLIFTTYSSMTKTKWFRGSVLACSRSSCQEDFFIVFAFDSMSFWCRKLTMITKNCSWDLKYRIISYLSREYKTVRAQRVEEMRLKLESDACARILQRRSASRSIDFLQLKRFTISNGSSPRCYHAALPLSGRTHELHHIGCLQMPRRHRSLTTREENPPYKKAENFHPCQQAKVSGAAAPGPNPDFLEIGHLPRWRDRRSFSHSCSTTRGAMWPWQGRSKSLSTARCTAEPT